MAMTFMDFEKPLEALYEQLQKLKEVGEKGELDVTDMVRELETKITAKRKEIYTEVQKQLTDAAPWIWLYVGYEYRVMQPTVQGFTPMSNGATTYLRETWLNK